MSGPFERAPFIVIWEVTRACGLACVHCRAEAIPYRHPDELSTEEGIALIESVRRFGDPPPLLVLTGGDPLRRKDVAELVAHAHARGFSVALTPSGTAAATEERLRALRDAGLARLAVSLDGATAEAHDAFRGVTGSHRHTLKIIERARALGLPLQINTTVSRRTVADLPALAGQVEAMGAVLWALFFLIPVGRAQADLGLDAAAIEDVLVWASDLARRVPFGVKTTEAPHFHRVLAQRRGAAPAHRAPTAVAGRAAPGAPPFVGRAGRAVTDGNGFVFVDHVGNVCPSGFLPLVAGNVRRDDIVDVYRESELFRSLRDPERLGGRCGACEYREVCGGSRARAWALGGGALGEDPGCAWQPSAAARVIAGASEAPGGAPAAPASAVPAVGTGPGAPAGPSEAEVRQALRTVFDPELGMSVIELGLIYAVSVTGAHVAITMTLTARGCPLHDVMQDGVRETVRALPGVESVDVTLTFDPPWTPERIER